jgi:glycosyltransferase involved in cell wall biosynthesis
MTQPLVSVVMASYNHEPFVDETIASVLGQTLQDFEFIVTDDGSTDGTADRAAAHRDPRIHLHRFAGNRGACVAMNNSVRHAAGRYIAMINSDDSFVAQKLETQSRFLEEHPDVTAVFSRVQAIDEHGIELDDDEHVYARIFDQQNRARHEWLRTFFLSGNCLCHPSLMIRADAYNRIGPYDERLQQLPDFDMWVRVCLREEIYVLPERLTRFRVFTSERNASAPRPETFARHLWEHRRIFDHFLKLSAQDVARMLPEVCSGIEVEDADVPFLLARCALDGRGGNAHNLFGLETLYAVLGSADAARIERKFGFTTTDLLRIARGCDPFNILPLFDLKNRAAALEAKLGALAGAGPSPAPARPRSLLRSVLASAFRSRR